MLREMDHFPFSLEECSRAQQHTEHGGWCSSRTCSVAGTQEGNKSMIIMKYHNSEQYTSTTPVR